MSQQDPHYLQNDPLSPTQKQQLLAFAKPYLMAALQSNLFLPDRSAFTQPGRATTAEEREKAAAIDAKLAPHLPPDHPPSRFTAAIQFPAAEAALGIDPQNHGQAYAARIFLRSVLKARVQLPPARNPEFTEDIPDPFSRNRGRKLPNPYYIPPLTDDLIMQAALSEYKTELCNADRSQGRDSDKIAPKHLLRIQNDPVQKLPQTAPTPLDTLLAQTFFQTGRWSTHSSYDPKTGVTTSVDNFQDREQFRAIIKRVITTLTQDRRTRPVMEAFAAICRKEDSAILLSHTDMSIGNLGERWGLGGGPLDANGGFYIGSNNAVVSSGLVNSATVKASPSSAGMLTHEILHMVLDTIFQQNASPTASPADEAAIDRAIAADQAIRKQLCPDGNSRKLSPEEQAVWNSVVTQLEEDPDYWKNGVEGNKKTMRVEIIVRPMEVLANAIVAAAENPALSPSAREESIARTMAAIAKLQPNVFKYYNEKCAPAITRFTQQATLDQLQAARTAPAASRNEALGTPKRG